MAVPCDTRETVTLHAVQEAELTHIPPMSYAVLLLLDGTLACPMILGDGCGPLPGGDSLRYRFVAQTQSLAQALRLADMLQPVLSGGHSSSAGDAGGGVRRPA